MKTTTIGIFGPSCSGKTAVATALASGVGCEVRHCGEIVRERATALGVFQGDLPDDQHRAIDEETRAAAIRSGPPLVIDGTFLDYVLYGVEFVWLLELNASVSERERRHNERQIPGGISSRDAADDVVRRRLYRSSDRARAQYMLDTTRLSISEVVADIERQWREA